MAEIKLENSINNPEIESMLVGLLSLVELTFPGRILACYLGGSRSDGTAVISNGTDPNASDLDVLVVFAGQLFEEETSRFTRLAAACNTFSKIWLDVNLTSEEQLKKGSLQLALLKVLVKRAKVFLYGKDIRPSVELPPLKDYLIWLVASGFYSIGSIRQDQHPAKLPFSQPVTYPVMAPEPQTEFGGYDFYLHQLPDGTFKPGDSGLRWLVGEVLWLAAFRLANKNGCYTSTKRETVQKYAELINDEWTDLVTRIFEDCKLKWHYLVPTGATERAKLAGLCQRLPGYENQFLEEAQAYLLQIVNEGVNEDLKPEVWEVLQMVNLPNPVLQKWILQNDPNKK